ncbi:MAG: DUF4975 domain-containing protein, partial [Anaerolineae bacterium]|nr:DUF4975 domain-containing protein [Anaerolineae bacterium]
NDTFDGRAFYAAKTASDGVRRFVFGWVPTRTGENDTGSWNWGGSLVVHEVFQQPDGSLLVSVPPEVTAHFAQPVVFQPQPMIGTWRVGADTLQTDTAGTFAWCKLAEMPDPCCIEATVRCTDDTRGCGLVLRGDAGLDRGYVLRIEPFRQRITFERFPRPGDEPPIIERSIVVTSHQPIRLRVFAEGSVIVAYVDDRVALSTRGYEHVDGVCGVFVSEGKAAFSGLKVSAP